MPRSRSQCKSDDGTMESSRDHWEGAGEGTGRSFDHQIDYRMTPPGEGGIERGGGKGKGNI